MRNKTLGWFVAVLAVAVLAFIAVRYFFFTVTPGPAAPRVVFNPAPVPPAEVGAHPNVLLVIADDFGKDADPCHPDIGSEKPSMPNLEAICDSGVVFDNFWTNPVCSPTRATMLTGLYGFRTGVTNVDDVLDYGTRSLADDLANETPVPYANAFIGKWHLAGPAASADPTAPWGLGVQHFFGFLGGGVRDYFQYQLVDDGERRPGREYTTTAFTDDAIDWLAEQKKKEDARPWFLWLAYNSPHAPFHLPPKDLITDKSLTGDDIDESPRPYYFAALEALDKELGRLLASLSAAERANTVIVFIGDNGTPEEVIQDPYAANTAKGTVYEGGVWGVLAVSGAGVTRRGEREDALVNSTDIFATIDELASADAPAPEDSVSFVGAFTDPAFTGRSFAFTEYERGWAPRQWAVRDARYKLVVRGGGEELYDLTEDPFEANDLLEGDPSAEILAKVKELKEQEEVLRAMD